MACQLPKAALDPAPAGSESFSRLPIITDVGQSARFARSGLGEAPTYARSSRMAVLHPGQDARTARLLDTATALDLHSFPEGLSWGRLGVTAKRDMVGNTQHVRAAAAAMLMAMSLTEPGLESQDIGTPALFLRVEHLDADSAYRQ